MDAQRFEMVLQAAQNLITNDVSDLVAAGLHSQVRSDGLPQDWVDNLPNLTAEQAAELKNALAGCEYQWAQSLHGML